MPKVIAPFTNYHRLTFLPNTFHQQPLVFYFSPRLFMSTSWFLNHVPTLRGAERGGGEKFRWDKGRGGRARAGSCCEHWLLSARLKLMESDKARKLLPSRTHTHAYKQHTLICAPCNKAIHMHRRTHTRTKDYNSVYWLMMALPRLHSTQHSISICAWSFISFQVWKGAYSLLGKRVYVLQVHIQYVAVSSCLY